jgi:transcriptional regulator
MHRTNLSRRNCAGLSASRSLVSELTGKWKVSQNRPEPTGKGVHAGLTKDGAAEMAELVRRYGGL